MTCKSLVLSEVHRDLGAKMAPFAGYEMPVSYTSIQDEHRAVRLQAGLFDVSHMGEFIVRGKEAFDLVQYLTTNDVSKLEIGDVQYSCLPNDQGGIIDDLLIYRLDEDQCSEGERAYMLVVNAGNMEKDWDWINEHNTFDSQIENISSQCGLLALQGPASIEILSRLTSADVAALPYYHFLKTEVAGLDQVLVSATGYTGSGGFEIYVRDQQLKSLWDSVMQAGKDLGLRPAGLGARDTLRLEMGYCLHGQDIDATTNPFEAGLGWIVKLSKPGPFRHRTLLQGMKDQGLQRRLVAFVCDGRRVPRNGYPLLNAGGDGIGHVTSGTNSPTLDTPIGLGYVAQGQHQIGTKLLVDLGKKTMDAEIVRLPFVQI